MACGASAVGDVHVLLDKYLVRPSIAAKTKLDAAWIQSSPDPHTSGARLHLIRYLRKSHQLV